MIRLFSGFVWAILACVGVLGLLYGLIQLAAFLTGVMVTW